MKCLVYVSNIIKKIFNRHKDDEYPFLIKNFEEIEKLWPKSIRDYISGNDHSLMLDFDYYYILGIVKDIKNTPESKRIEAKRILLDHLRHPDNRISTLATKGLYEIIAEHDIKK